MMKMTFKTLCVSNVSTKIAPSTRNSQEDSLLATSENVYHKIWLRALLYGQQYVASAC